MPIITIRELDARGNLQEVAWVRIDGDQVAIEDPQGYLDTSVPTPVVEDLGRGAGRRARFEDDQMLWAWNLPYLLRGPYLLATRS